MARSVRPVVVGVALAGSVAAALGLATTPLSAAPRTASFVFTGAAQLFTVPPGVCRLSIDAFGAQGGRTAGFETSNVSDSAAPPTGSPSAFRAAQVRQTPGALGGRAVAVVPVTPGEILQVHVGGVGGDATVGAAPPVVGGPGGLNGGGPGGSATGVASSGAGGGGGGASDVRRGGATLAARVVVAGGGGGVGGLDNPNGADSVGGAGGGTSGVPGGAGSGAAGGGGGGTAVGGGGGGANAGLGAGTAGVAGVGGDGAGGALIGRGGGGGGGGLFGGGGGGGATETLGSAGGGGGGSGFGPAGTTFETGVRSGNGQVNLTFDQEAGTCPSPAVPPTIPPAAAPIPIAVEPAFTG